MSCEPVSLLSRREQEVAALICNGLPNKLIAQQLGLTVGTFKQHVHNILLKLISQARPIDSVDGPFSQRSKRRARSRYASSRLILARPSIPSIKFEQIECAMRGTGERAVAGDQFKNRKPILVTHARYCIAQCKNTEAIMVSVPALGWE